MNSCQGKADQQRNSQVTLIRGISGTMTATSDEKRSARDSDLVFLVANCDYTIFGSFRLPLSDWP